MVRAKASSNDFRKRDTETVKIHQKRPLNPTLAFPEMAKPCLAATLTSTRQSQLSFEALWAKAAALQHHGAKVIIFLSDARTKKSGL